MSDQSAPVLVIEHAATCPPGLLATALTRQGIEVDLRRPYLGEELPASLADHDGLVVLGGEMNAYDDEKHAWLTTTKALLAAAHHRQVPALGICLGHQLAAVALGGEVRPNPWGQQCGVVETGWTPAATDDPLVGEIAWAGATMRPTGALHWNHDLVLQPPAGAVVLAATGRGEIQALRYGPLLWGLQCHPEVDVAIVQGWTLEAMEQDPEHSDRYAAALADFTRVAPRVRDQWEPLWVAFAGLVLEPERPTLPGVPRDRDPR